MLRGTGQKREGRVALAGAFHAGGRPVERSVASNEAVHVILDKWYGKQEGVGGQPGEKPGP